LNWIDAAQLSGLLREKRRTRQHYHQVAVATGILTPGRVAALLAIQRQSPELVGRHLVAEQAFSEQVLQEELRAYYRFLGNQSSIS
jgi:hypothetical protein